MQVHLCDVPMNPAILLLLLMNKSNECEGYLFVVCVSENWSRSSLCYLLLYYILALNLNFWSNIFQGGRQGRSRAGQKWRKESTSWVRFLYFFPNRYFLDKLKAYAQGAARLHAYLGTPEHTVCPGQWNHVNQLSFVETQLRVQELIWSAVIRHAFVQFPLFCQIAKLASNPSKMKRNYYFQTSVVTFALRPFSFPVPNPLSFDGSTV